MTTNIAPAPESEPAEETQPGLSDPGPWQRLPTELSSSYSAFLKYLELGSNASLPQVAEALGKSQNAVYCLSSRHHWIERATAYRQHVSHQHLAALEVDRAKTARLWRTRTNLFREQQWESLQRMLLMHLEAGQRLLSKPDQEVTFPQFARFQDTICRLARFVALNPVNEDPASFGAHITNQMEEDFQTAYGEPFDPEKYAHLRVVPNSPSPSPTSNPDEPGLVASKPGEEEPVAPKSDEPGLVAPKPREDGPASMVGTRSTASVTSSPFVVPGQSGPGPSAGSAQGFSSPIEIPKSLPREMASVPAYLTAGKIENETLSPTPVGTCRDLSPLHSIPGAPDDARLSEAGARPPSPLPSSPIEIRKSKFENQINPPIPSINHQLKQPSTQIDQRLSHNLKPLAGGSPGKIVPLKPIPAPPEPKTEDHWAALNKLINTPDAQGNCGAGVHLTRSSILP